MHRHVFYLKHDVSETWFCLRLQVVPTQLDAIDRASRCLQKPIRYNLKSETQPSQVVF
jgi:hypothetical protein